MLHNKKWLQHTKINVSIEFKNMHTLFPLEIRMFPVCDRYVVSSHPFASSPSNRKGTGYGTLKGKNLKENAALSNWNRMRFPSLTRAAAWFKNIRRNSK
jgi:hypothetical protein